MKKLSTKSTFILFLIATCIGCQPSSRETEEFITVDVTASYPKKELILQDFLDVEYIPLETSDQFITSGFVQAIGKELIVVRDINQTGTGNIFIFDKDGKGVRKINRKGQGNEEYTFISGITLDEENNEMFVNCLDLRKIFVYDLLGNFKRSFKYMEGRADTSILKTDFRFDPIYNFDCNNLICQDYSSGRIFTNNTWDLEHRNIFWIISKQDGRVIKEIQIPYENKILQILIQNEHAGVVRNAGIIPYHNNWLLVEPSADTLYSYSADNTLKPFIVRTPSIQSMNPEIFLFPGVITDRYYFMQGIKKEFDDTDQYSGLQQIDWMYDKEQNKVFEYIVYNSDFVDKRPIKNLVNAILELTLVNSDEIAFAEKIEANELVDAYKKGKLKGKLKEIAANLNEESNAVIMLAKYKK